MRLAVAAILGVVSLHAQNCVPVRLLPSGLVSAALDASSCTLPDGSLYALYRLDLPSPGRIGIDLTTAAQGFGLILRDASGARLDGGGSISRPIEAGSNMVLVTGASAAYSLRTTFTAEPGWWCTAFPNAGLNRVIAGTLGSSGCVTPDGTPYEAYNLTTLGDGVLTVSTNSGDFDTRLVLRDSDGYALASDAAQVAVPVDGGNQYQIVVTTAAHTGAFQLTTAFQPADAETCRPRMSLSDSGSDNTTITGDACSLVSAQTGTTVYYNYYEVTVPAAGMADLSVTSSDFAATLNLLDDGGNLLASDSGGGASPGQSQIRFQLAAGKYLAQVLSPAMTGGAYMLAYLFTPGAPLPCAATAMNAGDAVTGMLSAAACRTATGAADLYRLTLDASGTLDLTLTSAAFSGVLAIRDAQDNLMFSGTDAQGLGIVHLTADLPAGAYLVAVAAANGSGTYQLSSSLARHDLTPCTFVQSLDINGGYIQKLGPASCRDANGQPVDFYRFTLPNDAVVAAFMTSSEVDGVLTLTDDAGNYLRSDQNSYGDNDAMIVQYLPAGAYRLAARASGGATAGGYYEVDVRNVQGPHPPFCSPRPAPAPGSAVTGSLGIASCQYPDATFADVYRIDLPADSSIDLRMNSGDFDAYLVLLDSQGSVVDQDDDSGGDTNARIARGLPAGTYYAVAKASAGYVSVGVYTLSLASLP